MALDQLLRLAQTLQLSPSLLQSMEILQMNTLELSQYLSNLALENPVMEYTEGAGDSVSWEEFSSQVPWLGDTPAPSAQGDGPMPEAGTVEGETETLEFLLRDQLDRLQLPPPLAALCAYLVDLLDPHGRLNPEDLDGLVQAGVPQTLLDRGVEVLQSLDPAGVGGRSVGESLALQLERLPGDHALEIQLCLGYLELLAKKSYSVLAARLGVSEAKIQEAAGRIQTLDPDPVRELAPPPSVEYIRPDAWVAEVEGELRVFVNQWDLPQFHLSSGYLQMERSGQEAEAADYLRQKIRQAQWVLQCVQRRQNTLETCLNALVQAQAASLGNQEAPSPLLRRELAETLGVHPSTVTRTLGHKCIQCRQGLFSTGHFFSRKTGGGDRPLSEQALRLWIARMVREEDPAHPYSDQDLSERLAAEGITLARRTVAKYRKALGIPPSYRRRR